MPGPWDDSSDGSFLALGDLSPGEFASIACEPDFGEPLCMFEVEDYGTDPSIKSWALYAMAEAVDGNFGSHLPGSFAWAYGLAFSDAARERHHREVSAATSENPGQRVLLHFCQGPSSTECSELGAPKQAFWIR